MAVIQTDREEESKIFKRQQQEEDPISNFMYALKAPATRRQWPRRLKRVFDFVFDNKLSSKSLEEQAREFVTMTRDNPKWAQNNLIRFLIFSVKES